MSQEKNLIIKAVAVVAVIVAVGVFYSHRKEGSVVSTGDQAAMLVKEKYPEYNDYPSDNLPPKRVEVAKEEGGWYVGMYMLGSGLPGILKANCFHVTQSGVVTEIGQFGGEGPAQAINIATCTPKE